LSPVGGKRPNVTFTQDPQKSAQQVDGAANSLR